jgi:hypothetical protein
MKYLLTILGIICVASLLTLYFVWPDKPMQDSKVAVTVNGHDLAKTTVAAEGTRGGYHNEDYAELLDSVIMRELLIQAAQLSKIDKEESFRESLKTFYEQSLIKILMDRQYEAAQVTVDEAEVDAYLSFFGKRVTFTRLPVTPNPPHAPIPEKGTQNEVLFDDLAEPMKLLLSNLKTGEFDIRFDTGSERYAVRLDKVVPVLDVISALPDRESVKQMLTDQKRQQCINDWLDELRSKASITIHNNG